MAKSNETDGAETPRQPDPMEVLLRVTAALEAIAAKSAPASEDSNAIAVLTQALARMTDSQMEGAKLIALETRRAARPSNEVIPNVSVFNRRGTMLGDEYQKPKLKCKMLLPWEAEDESMTREEVELLNLMEAGIYTIHRIDRSKITVTVQVQYGVDNISPTHLVMQHDTAYNNDNFRLMPPFADMLREMLRQHDRSIAQIAKAVLTDEEEEALIEAGELSVSA